MNEPLRRQVRVACPVAHAFRIFTERIDLWWPQGHRKSEQSELNLEGFVGGRFFERLPDGGEFLLGEILVYTPPERIRFSWHPGKLTKPTEVDVRFTPIGESTLVEVEHREGSSDLGPLWQERVQLFQRGWQRVFEALAAYIDTAGVAEK